MNNELPDAFVTIFSKLDNTKALTVIEYFGREGVAVVDNFPDVLKSLDNIGISDNRIIYEILTNNRKSKVFSEILTEEHYKILDDLYNSLSSPGRKTIATTTDGKNVLSGWGG